MAAEIYLDAIPAKRGSQGFMRPAYTPPALQGVTRDFAFLVPAELPAGDLVRTVKGADKENIVAARMFDQFVGQGVPDGQKSLAVEVTLQPGDKSYGEAELKAIADKVVAAAAKLGAQPQGVSRKGPFGGYDMQERASHRSRLPRLWVSRSRPFRVRCAVTGM